MTGIEWDEELPQPPRRELPGSPRARALVAVAALALTAGVAVVAWPRGATSTAARSRTTTAAGPSPSLSPTPIAAAPVLTPPRACQGVPGDLGPSACSTTARVPRALTAAVRRSFPTAYAVTSTTTLVHHREPLDRVGLWSRYFTAHVADEGQVFVVVGRGAAPDQAPVTTHAEGRTTVYTRRIVDGYTVQVEVIAPDGTMSSVAAAAGLAGDARLVTLE